ncbi:MAG: hypothetical protein ABIP48_08315, partial [Planctomycetota bacterium]
LATRPEELKHFQTSSRWTAVERVQGSANLWRIRAEEDSVLELDIGSGKTPLYLAPGFRGKLHLNQGESALVFGEAFIAEVPQTLVITWEGVEVVRDRPSAAPPVLLTQTDAVVGLVAILTIVVLAGTVSFVCWRRARSDGEVDGEHAPNQIEPRIPTTAGITNIALVWHVVWIIAIIGHMAYSIQAACVRYPSEEMILGAFAGFCVSGMWITLMSARTRNVPGILFGFSAPLAAVPAIVLAVGEVRANAIHTCAEIYTIYPFLAVPLGIAALLMSQWSFRRTYAKVQQLSGWRLATSYILAAIVGSYFTLQLVGGLWPGMMN